jgi:hypothetical protein
MLNVSKYDHLCENLTFNGYLCEICSMFENMAICVTMRLLLDICVKYAQCVKNLTSVSELCVVSEVLCLVSDRHYTESGNNLVSDEEKGRHAV